MKEIKSFQKLSEEELSRIEGGGFPLPDWDQFLNGICGFVDGLTGHKHVGHC